MAEGPGRAKPAKPAKPAKMTKNASMLLVFLSGARLNRFEAEGHYDHCLNSTISTLEGFGLVFDRVSERVPSVRGTKLTRCNRYWLNRSPDNLALAHDRLAQWGVL